MTKASDNVYPKVILGPLGAPTAPADASWKLYPMADGVYAVSSNTTVGPFGSGGGGITAGTAFPGAPADNDLFHRTDLDKLFFYDGTRWMTVNEMELSYVTRTALGTGITGTQTLWNAPTRMSQGDMYITRFEMASYVATTSDGTKYWSVTLDKLDAANSATTIGTLSTVSNTADNWVEEGTDINAVVAGSAHVAFRCIATKVSTPGSFLAGIRVKYREIAT